MDRQRRGLRVVVCSISVLCCIALVFGILSVPRISNAKVSKNTNNLGGPPTPTLVNEIVVNPNSTDSNCEYVEFIGAPGAALTGLYFVSLEGDSTKGTATFVGDLTAGALGSNGLLVFAGNDPSGTCDGRDYGAPSGTVVARTSSFGGSGGLQNGTNSFLLINSPTTALVPGTDYDTNDDGTLDALPMDATIVDGFGWSDGGSGDIIYGGIELPQTAGGTNDMATRFPGNLDALSVPAWYHGDMDGTADSTSYDLTQVSANFPPGGALTPGLPNVGTPSSGATDVDFDGDGKTDYAVIRDLSTATNNAKNSSKTDSLGGGAGTSLEWWITNSSDSSTTVASFGSSIFSDTYTPADFDGDGKSDIAIWRGANVGQPSANGFFYIINSSDSTIDTIDFGQIGDDAAIVGDYDGDGKADPAVFRCPGAMLANGGGVGGQCTFYYKGSAGMGETTFVPWGNNSQGSIRPYPGDFDGDGSFDFAIYRPDPGATPAFGLSTPSQYVVLQSSDSAVNYISWGLSDDVLAPGDYDGDGKTDFMNLRESSGAGFGTGGQVLWYLLEADGGGTGASPIFWGNTNLPGFDEQLAIGDYDGDGSTDIAIWRRDNSDPANSYYYIRRSSDLTLQTFEWGAPGFVVVNGWNQSN